MAKILYFDAFNGVAGDMILGALLDLGMPLDFLTGELKKLHLSPWEIRAEKINREGMSGVNLSVVYGESAEGGHKGHAHNHHKHHHFTEIRDLILESELDEWVKESSISVFTRLAEAEARVHESTVERVHFHEVGAIDSIVDIVGSCIGFKYFGIERFVSSPLELGGGTVTFSHGTWPVPAPATAELVKSFPVRLGGAEAEMTTPTGAAIVTTLAKTHRIPGAFEIERVGLGAGDRDIKGIPNMLRLILGKTGADSGPGDPGDPAKDRIVVLESNVDDMIPEDSGYFMEKALAEGALDVFFTPVFMKKNRPGLQITVLSPEDREAEMVSLIFRETTSLGIRRKVTERYTMERETIMLDTRFGKVRLKKGLFQGETVKLTPEFEDLRRIAKEHNLTLSEARREITKRVFDEDFQ